MTDQKKASFLTCSITIMCLFLPSILLAQYIQLSLEMEPQAKVQTERNLDFGVLVPNAGRRTIELGDINMGIFGITALEGQEIILRLNKPEVLTHNNPAINQSIPLQLFTRYGYSRTSFANSRSFSGTTNVLVEENPDIGPWNTLYLFIYGSIIINNIPEGNYSNDIVLNIQYI